MPNRKQRTTIAVEYPFPSDRVFRYQAMQDVLARLIEEPYEEFAVGTLAEMIEANQATVSKALKLLKKLGCVETRQEGRKQYVRINRSYLTKPDPILSIPQSEFHQPVKALVTALKEELAGLVGVVLFGSVARGTADRSSDIDLLVIVEDEKTAARRSVQSVVSDLEEQKFDGDRFTFETLVETPASAKRIGERLRQQFDEGIMLVGSEQLSEIRAEVYGNEE